jgi:hypothetical protein
VEPVETMAAEAQAVEMKMSREKRIVSRRE